MVAKHIINSIRPTYHRPILSHNNFNEQTTRTFEIQSFNIIYTHYKIFISDIINNTIY